MQLADRMAMVPRLQRLQRLFASELQTEESTTTSVLTFEPKMNERDPRFIRARLLEH
jgi:hypothetical protein